MNNKISSLITDRIIEEMEKGIIPWNKPWTGVGAVSHTTGKAYSLINQFLLGNAGEWITYNQCKAEGGTISKGAKGRPVVFWKQIKVTEEDKDGNPKEKIVPMLRYYTVFNIKDCEGIKEKYPAEAIAHISPIDEAESVVTNYQEREGLEIVRDKISDRAYYAPYSDKVVVPAMEQFSDASEYYSTLFHEITHSTGHSSRLNRFSSGAGAAAFGSEEYSKEELVAEIGAATLNNHVGIETKQSFRNSTAYLQSWMRALKSDPNMIISAAGKAEKAVNYILEGAKA